MKKLLYLVMTVLLLFSFAGCQTKTSKNKYKSLVICSNEVIYDLMDKVGGDFIDTRLAIRRGNDPHFYKLNEKDIIRLTDATLIMYNGAGLEGRLEWAVARMGNITTAVPLLNHVPKNMLIYNGKEINPHFWHNVKIWEKAVSFAADNLSQLNPVNEQVYRQKEEIYLYILDELDSYIRAQVEKIPENKRIIVTEHDAFAYFGKEYGFETISLQGSDTKDEISTEDINNLADEIIRRKIDTVFLEAALQDRNIRLLQSTLRARGHDVYIGGTLYADTLLYGGDYAETMRYNIDTITKALTK